MSYAGHLGQLRTEWVTVPAEPTNDTTVVGGVRVHPRAIRNTILIGIGIFAVAYLLKDTKYGQISREYAAYRQKRGMDL